MMVVIAFTRFFIACLYTNALYVPVCTSRNSYWNRSLTFVNPLTLIFYCRLIHGTKQMPPHVKQKLLLPTIHYLQNSTLSAIISYGSRRSRFTIFTYETCRPRRFLHTGERDTIIHRIDDQVRREGTLKPPRSCAGSDRDLGGFYIQAGVTRLSIGLIIRRG